MHGGRHQALTICLNCSMNKPHGDSCQTRLLFSQLLDELLDSCFPLLCILNDIEALTKKP